MNVPFSKSFTSCGEALSLLLLIAAVLASRLPFLMHGLDEWDSANFALSVVHFDILNHQPHPPGQFFYVRLMQLINVLTDNELLTLSLASAIGSSFALVPYYFALRQIFRPAVALGATVLTSFTPGFWITSLRMVSDPVTGLFVYGVVSALLAGLTNRLWFLFGMALCGAALGVKQSTVYFLAPFAIAVNGVVWYRTGVRRPLLGSVVFAMVIAAWLLPTVGNCHGWANYWAVCRSMQRDNYDNESIIFHLSAEAIRTQWQHNLLQPWGTAALAIGMLTLMVLGLIVCLRRGLHGRLFVLFSLSVTLYAFFFLYRFNKYYVYYVPIYAAFAAAALFAIGNALARRMQRPVLQYALPALAIALITTVNFGLTLPMLPKVAHFRAPPQAALEALRKRPAVDSTPLLLTDDRTTQHELLYFHLKKKVHLLNLHPDLQDAAAALNSGHAVYFLSSQTFRGTTDQAEPGQLIGHYVWRPELYDALQGRPDLRQLSLYEVTAPLPAEYLFTDTGSHAPLLQRGMWEDGWCGSDSRLLLPCDGPGAAWAHLRFTVHEGFGYRYPYRLACQFADGRRIELTIMRPGQSDFIVPLPNRPGVHTVEMQLLAPQTFQPSQHDTRSTDNRDLSVHLDELECVTDSHPLLVHREGGWYDLESDGNTQSRWTDGRATLSVLMNHPGTLVLEGAVLSFTDDNTVEIFVDDRQVQANPLPGTEWIAMTWRLSLEAGFHRLMLHSRHPGVHPPDDGRVLALRVRDLRSRLEP